MRGTVLSLDTWLDPNYQVPSLVYLDALDWRLFVDWLAQDTARPQQLLARRWQVRLFKSQLNRSCGSAGHRTQKLLELGIQLDEAKIHSSDEMFISEALLVYFHNDSTARPQAELLALSRRQAGNGQLAVISQHRGYWRIPLVNTYFVDISRLRGQDDLPAQFDFLQDLDIHRQLALAVGSRLDTTPYGDTVFAAIIALRDYVKQMSGLPADGYSLMEQAFAANGSHLHLNPLTSCSHKNEQKGFLSLYCGVMTGLRNPLAHEGASSAFAQARYPNKKALLKYLSFLSILLERADHPLP